MRFKENSGKQVSEHLTTLAHILLIDPLAEGIHVESPVNDTINNGVDWDCIYTDVGDGIANRYTEEDIRMWIKLLRSKEYRSFLANKDAVGQLFQESFKPHLKTMKEYMENEITIRKSRKDAGGEK
jgi:hypothetical protein